MPSPPPSIYKTEFFALIKLAVPLVLAHVAQNTVSFVDTVMAGRLENEAQAIAGIALGSTTWYLVTFVLAGVLLGLNPVVSQANGAGDDVKIASALQQSFLLCLLMTLPATLLFWQSDALFQLLGQAPEVVTQSSAYLRAISWGLIPTFGYMALRATLEGLSDTRPILATSVVCVLLNVVANEVLMFGRFGFPELGLVGTGYASAIVMTTAFLILLIHTLRTYPQLFQFSRWINFAAMWELLKIGIPIGLTIGFEISMFSAAAFEMGKFGTEALAAHQIVMQTAGITFMIPLGIAIALSVRIGLAAGAQDLVRARVAGYVGIGTSGAVMCFSAIAFLTVPKMIISMYIDIHDPNNTAVVDWATRFLCVAAGFQLFDGLQVSASNALRGLKDTTAAMMLTLLAYWGFGVASGWVLARGFGVGPMGLWYGLTIGLGTAAVLLISRYRWYFRSRS